MFTYMLIDRPYGAVYQGILLPFKAPVHISPREVVSVWGALKTALQLAYKCPWEVTTFLA